MALNFSTAILEASGDSSVSLKIGRNMIPNLEFYIQPSYPMAVRAE